MRALAFLLSMSVNDLKANLRKYRFHAVTDESKN